MLRTLGGSASGTYSVRDFLDSFFFFNTNALFHFSQNATFFDAL